MNNEQEHFYHMFANGDDAKNFITTESEFKAAFNLFGVCSVITGVTVLASSVEDSHPHGLLYGTFRKCLRFAKTYEDISRRSIYRRRGTLDGVSLNCEIYEITNEQYLMNVGTYVITQATKDGKAVMPYDYKYGTGALYFRSKNAILPWMISEDGSLSVPRRFGDLPDREKRMICGSRMTDLPEDWKICNGFILPDSYIDVKGFENIYKTHNCFRAFLASGKSKDEIIFSSMAQARGVIIEDLEARALCGNLCQSMFGHHGTRHLTSEERIILATTLRKTYRLSFRQLSTLTKIPESELRKYIR